eukprot:m.239238 g.239238  ORF g.239238 m.239238 type:complete len:72 (+) comp15294_c1_seq2:741-956(+)
MCVAFMLSSHSTPRPAVHHLISRTVIVLSLSTSLHTTHTRTVRGEVPLGSFPGTPALPQLLSSVNHPHHVQ